MLRLEQRCNGKNNGNIYSRCGFAFTPAFGRVEAGLRRSFSQG